MQSAITIILEPLREIYGKSKVGNAIFIASIILFLLISGLVINEATGYLYYRDMEKRIEILKSLQELSEKDIEQNSELYPMYQNITDDLENYERLSLSGSGSPIIVYPLAKDTTSVTIWKFWSGGWLLLIGIWALVDGYRKNSTGWKPAFFFFLIFGVMLGYIGTQIPTINYTIVSCMLYIFFQSLIGYLLFKVFAKTSNKKPEASANIG